MPCWQCGERDADVVARRGRGECEASGAGSRAVRPLAELIAADLATWDVPHVELAIYRTADAGAIAGGLEALCCEALGSP